LELGVTSDSLWLAEFASPVSGDRVCELGCGEGIITLELAARINTCIIGIDISEDAVRAAQKNAEKEAASLEGEVEFKNINIKEAPRELGRFSFDGVVCNPPFFRAGEGRPSPDLARRRAREEGTIDLKSIITVSGELLKEKGLFWGILPAERLSELALLCDTSSLSFIQIRPVYTKPDSPARRILFTLCKGSNAPLEILPPITV
jgi:tRNA1Val (adenine37-N6)-methyltransferase